MTYLGQVQLPVIKGKLPSTFMQLAKDFEQEIAINPKEYGFLKEL